MHSRPSVIAPRVLGIRAPNAECIWGVYAEHSGRDHGRAGGRAAVLRAAASGWCATARIPGSADATEPGMRAVQVMTVRSSRWLGRRPSTGPHASRVHAMAACPCAQVLRFHRPSARSSLRSHSLPKNCTHARTHTRTRTRTRMRACSAAHSWQATKSQMEQHTGERMSRAPRNGWLHMWQSPTRGHGEPASSRRAKLCSCSWLGPCEVVHQTPLSSSSDHKWDVFSVFTEREEKEEVFLSEFLQCRVWTGSQLRARRPWHALQ
jgi:hypothetical protein